MPPMLRNFLNAAMCGASVVLFIVALTVGSYGFMLMQGMFAVLFGWFFWTDDRVQAMVEVDQEHKAKEGHY